MNTTLLTANSEEYQPLADLTVPGKIDYAKRYGFDFVLRTQKPPLSCWQRPRIWSEELERLEDGDWLFFTGTDVLITNHTIDVRDYYRNNPDSDLLIGADGNGINVDSWLLRKCDATVKFLAVVCAREGKCANEQDAVNVALSGYADYDEFTRRMGSLKTGGEPPSEKVLNRCQTYLNRSPVHVKILPQREINAYPILEFGGTGLEPHSWAPGDFVCHLPGKSLEYRLKVFPEYISKIVR